MGMFIVYILVTLLACVAWMFFGAMFCLFLDMCFGVDIANVIDEAHNKENKMWKRLFIASVFGPFMICSIFYVDYQNEIDGLLNRINLNKIFQKWIKS